MAAERVQIDNAGNDWLHLAAQQGYIDEPLVSPGNV
jgi:hypothetical protein